MACQSQKCNLTIHCNFESGLCLACVSQKSNEREDEIFTLGPGKALFIAKGSHQDLC